MEPGTDAHKVTVDGLTKLMDRAIEMEKLDIDAKEKAENRKIDKELKLKQMEEDRKDRIAKNALTAASIFGGFALTVWGTVKSIKFEETGTITTIMGRGFIQKLLPKK
jgi:hypothetical protein